jgi:ABC-type Fe3+/spermidine/putrescine transport system ATPase subunit
MSAGLERTESGTVTIDGTDGTHTSIQERNVGRFRRWPPRTRK